MSIRSFRDLVVWQRSMDLVTEVYRYTQSFPKHELYGLSSQLQRAAVSVPANIAEGHDRDSTKEYLRHIAIAVGSLAELETLLTIAHRLQYIDELLYGSSALECQTIGRMLRSLQRSLRKRLRSKEE